MSLATWIFGGLALLSLASVLVKRPWTIPLARRHNPPEVWSTALFLETNMLITSAWAVLFGGAAVLAAVAPLWINLSYGGLLLVLGRLSSRFGSWYASRRLGAAGQPGAE
jgi:hypothetical protein